MGLHTGEAQERGDDYFGAPLNRAARVMDAARGGQVALSSITAEIVGRPTGGDFVDLGVHRLKGLVEPVHMFVIRAAGLAWVDRPLVTSQETPGNLPVAATEFIGGVAELRRRFVDGAVLTMPAGGSGTSDTTGSVGIPGAGTVFFRNFTLSAKWGRLNANNGVLRSADGTTLSVPVTRPLEGTTLRGDGWSATLNSGWVVRPAARSGSFVIVREN